MSQSSLVKSNPGAQIGLDQGKRERKERQASA